MADSQKRILEMLAEGKITAAEAEKLLSLVEPKEDSADRLSDTTTGTRPSPKYIRVVVQPDSKSEPGSQVERVNIRIPINLIRAGMKLSTLIPPQAAGKVNEALKEHSVNFDLRNIKPGDIESLIEALSDFEVDVQGGKEKVHIYTE